MKELELKAFATTFFKIILKKNQFHFPLVMKGNFDIETDITW